MSFDIPIAGTVFNATGGNLASTWPISASRILAFATKFANVFREHCVVGLKLHFKVNANSSTLNDNRGFIRVLFDEKSSATPTNDTANLPHLSLSADDPVSTYTLTWKAADYADLHWLDVTSPVNVGWLKLYSSTSDTGCTGTPSVTVSGSLAVDFRGFV